MRAFRWTLLLLPTLCAALYVLFAHVVLAEKDDTEEVFSHFLAICHADLPSLENSLQTAESLGYARKDYGRNADFIGFEHPRGFYGAVTVKNIEPEYADCHVGSDAASEEGLVARLKDYAAKNNIRIEELKFEGATLHIWRTWINGSVFYFVITPGMREDEDGSDDAFARAGGMIFITAWIASLPSDAPAND